MRTIAYIDGFNLYNRKLKDSPQFKWLNPYKLIAKTLKPQYNLEKAIFYTSKVSPAISPDSLSRQLIYFSALKTVKQIEVVEGNFSVLGTWAVLHMPLQAKPDDFTWSDPLPKRLKVKVAREKASDVNLASHLLRDAFQNKFDAAVVLSSDSDLAEPIRIARQDAGKVVIVLRPTNKQSGSLKAACSLSIALRDQDLAKAQFSDVLTLADGTFIHRPESWTTKGNG